MQDATEETSRTSAKSTDEPTPPQPDTYWAEWLGALLSLFGALCLWSLALWTISQLWPRLTPEDFRGPMEYNL